jgi:SAM-dependent methyltransferase
VSDRGRIHRDAEAFGLVPDAYERGRPEYPEAAIEALAQRWSLGPGVRVLDLAAGTGKLTRPLLATGAEVVAVEPVAGMRALISPAATVLDGVAEAIPLEDGSVDGVTVGQAFHWFRANEALREIHRVLRPRRQLAVVGNRRDESDDLQQRIRELAEFMRTRPHGFGDSDPSAAVEASGLFTAAETVRVPNRQELTVDALLDRFLSISFVAAATQEQRDAFMQQVRELVRDRPEPIVLPYVTEIFLATRV